MVVCGESEVNFDKGGLYKESKRALEAWAILKIEIVKGQKLMPNYLLAQLL